MANPRNQPNPTQFFMVWVSWIANLCFVLAWVKIHKRIIWLGLGWVQPKPTQPMDTPKKNDEIPLLHNWQLPRYFWFTNFTPLDIVEQDQTLQKEKLAPATKPSQTSLKLH